MRPVELVRRADEDVGARGADVDRPVRPEVHGVDPGERARLVRQRGDLRDGRDRPDRVRRPRERDHARALRQQRAEVVEIQPALVVDLGELHDQALVVRELEPRRDVAVVVELRADHFVARDPLAGRRAREREVQRRHVLPERHLVGGRVEELRRRLPERRSEQRVRRRATCRSRRRGSRSSRAGSRRSHRSPSPEPACRPARRRTRGAAAAPRSARGRPRSWSCPSPSCEVPLVGGDDRSATRRRSSRALLSPASSCGSRPAAAPARRRSAPTSSTNA